MNTGKPAVVGSVATMVAPASGTNGKKASGSGADNPVANDQVAGHRSLIIPPALLPRDGRFGSGPSKVRFEAAEEVARRGQDFLGTSHRRDGVRSVVGRLRSGMAELFELADTSEVLLGNGGSTSFWDSASFGLIAERSQHLCFGEFSEKFSLVTTRAPHLAMPDVIESEPGTHPEPRAPLLSSEAQSGIADGETAEVDAVALTHNETSTGVCAPVQRPDWTTSGANSDVITLVDGTSAAGAIAWDPSQADCYYFAPQKAFAADGGLWIALCSGKAIERIERLSGGGSREGAGRWTPASLDLSIALTNSRKNQTYNTPALTTILLTTNTLEWMLKMGGLEWSVQKAAANSTAIYEWAAKREWCQPFVADPQMRSPVVCTIDFSDEVSANEVAAVLRENGVVDIESYRKLGRNQLRIAAFPAIELADVEALCGCIDYVVERL